MTESELWGMEVARRDAEIKRLRAALNRVMGDIIPHVRDTGHNAVDREISEAIAAVKAAIQ